MFNRTILAAILFCVCLGSAAFAMSSEKSGRTVVKRAPDQKAIVKPVPKKVIKVKQAVKPAVKPADKAADKAETTQTKP